MTTTFDRIRTLLVKEHRLSPDGLTPDARLESLGIDSLATVELLWHIEDAFHIKLPTRPVELLTLGDVVRFVDELVAQQGSVARPTPEAMSTALRTP